MRHTLGDVEKMVGVRISVIKEWEREMPIVRPRRDKAGRMVYSDRDIRILRRLKYLLYDRRLSLKEARIRLSLEFSTENQDPRAQIALIRQDLIEVYEMVKNMGNSNTPSNS
ncbi:MAG: MerR family transcriptional regulator [Treponema sp.]|jgi:DNA-binding transcriptional MerR regulator|nr:MerR family transcriptional regulator [Treponema sp.]